MITLLKKQKIRIISCILLTFIGCSSDTQEYVNKKYGFRFKYPVNWTRLNKTEMLRRFPGKESLITISDIKRTAFFSIIEHKLNMSQQIFTAGNLTERHNIILSSIESAVSKRYQNYKLIKMAGTRFAGGGGASEIIFEGNLPWKKIEWQRLILFVPPETSDLIILFGINIPIDKKDYFVNDILFIEKNWQWTGLNK